MVAVFSWSVRGQIGNGGVRNALSLVVFIQEIADRNEIIEFGSIMDDLFEDCIDDRWRPCVLGGVYPPPV